MMIRTPGRRWGKEKGRVLRLGDRNSKGKIFEETEDINAQVLSTIKLCSDLIYKKYPTPFISEHSKVSFGFFSFPEMNLNAYCLVDWTNHGYATG